MVNIDKILNTLEELIKSGTYKDLETHDLEIKSHATGKSWDEIYRSVCAFLNTQGGYIIIGIHESSNKTKYTFTGYNSDNEDKAKTAGKKFTDDRGAELDLTEFVRPGAMEVRPFLDGSVCVIKIDKLPDYQKFVFYERIAYERTLSGDSKISAERIQDQRRIRAELELARELNIVQNTSLDDLDVDKLNEYISLLNKENKIHTLKTDIRDALIFLSQKKFIIDHTPTLLGMLVCGKNIFDHLQARCEVDGYVDGHVGIASNKKIMKDNIIPLMGLSVAFVTSNISTGVSLENGGSTVFEYPERLIRETVNNALAHRDYTTNKFVNIIITPNKHIEIRNPGKFNAENLLTYEKPIRIKRIIPTSKPRNPRLADVLKSYDRMEGRGLGMASLTNDVLENRIDLPYFILHTEEVRLIIPKGKLLDDEMNLWLMSFSSYIAEKTNSRELTEEQKTVLAYFFKSERLNKIERFTIQLGADNNHFAAIGMLESYGLIYKHSESEEIHPVYIVDRTLMKDDFTNELRALFGNNFDILAQEYKDVLEVVYHIDTFGNLQRNINATIVGDYLYFKMGLKKENTEAYNSFQRKTRKIINYLAKRSFIINQASETRPKYAINQNYTQTESAFGDGHFDN